MAGFTTGDSDDVISGINVTPLVDVVLVLLIIFIVTASAIVKAAISVDLPKATTAEAVSKPPLSVILACTEKQEGTKGDGCTPGALIVNGEPLLDLSVEKPDLEPFLEIVRREIAISKSEGEDGLNVLITADKDLRFQAVIWLMDVLKNEGVGGILFNSELFTKPGDASVETLR